MNLATHTHRTYEPRIAGPRSRRRHPRVTARGVAGHLQTRDASMPGLPVENISMGGVFVRTSAPLDLGTPVMMQVVRPGLKRAIQVTGRVVSAVAPDEARARGLVPGMGIGFDALEGEAAVRLRTLLDALDASATPATVIAQPAHDGGYAPKSPLMAAPVVVASAAPAPRPAAAPVDAAFFELAEARGRIDEQDARIAQLEEELREMRHEMLRRNRTIAELGKRLAFYEEV